jgi:hypothetical protein
MNLMQFKEICATVVCMNVPITKVKIYVQLFYWWFFKISIDLFHNQLDIIIC